MNNATNKGPAMSQTITRDDGSKVSYCEANVAERAKHVGYTHMLYFARNHTHGLCAGLVTSGRIPFCSQAAAIDWVRKINAIHARKPARNGYRVDQFQIVTL